MEDEKYCLIQILPEVDVAQLTYIRMRRREYVTIRRYLNPKVPVSTHMHVSEFEHAYARVYVYVHVTVIISSIATNDALAAALRDILQLSLLAFTTFVEDTNGTVALDGKR